MTALHPINQPSHMQHMSERDDALPFRELERAHRRRKLAVQELEAADAALEQAFERLKEAGYLVRPTAPGDELQEKAPIPPEQFRAEEAA